MLLLKLLKYTPLFSWSSLFKFMFSRRLQIRIPWKYVIIVCGFSLQFSFTSFVWFQSRTYIEWRFTFRNLQEIKSLYQFSFDVPTVQYIHTTAYNCNQVFFCSIFNILWEDTLRKWYLILSWFSFLVYFQYILWNSQPLNRGYCVNWDDRTKLWR